MNTSFIRVGTLYLPVHHVERAANWYEGKLDAAVNYLDDKKAIIDLAGLSLFLVKGMGGETANFQDAEGDVRFSITFEVDGADELECLHKKLQDKGVHVGRIEERGHPGKNFVFHDMDGNMFDVWSELSPTYRKTKN
ncbi:Catechol 2,3-dioxygenase [Halobacillus karajensis]|uniref:Glyoxalase-like domain protein n=1 Tax=Halobacillus karajensis TaxID=195088 RepID=A0A024P5E5_9BACI|nr:VOC family protein [Halobacillus karajensis]CDQ17843.1 Glyoxalase-like domain protein [Halobacillus karajensis]CDQ24249.1 Glyoxalase-like domain protein [Halobacillus karajensis]CDQ29502.1 Glyoxalase-like domain protein [Halobacillus karajensis]SEH62889.1 Catechol 2,3-dioxygenase [Halobacillus karajensis]